MTLSIQKIFDDALETCGIDVNSMPRETYLRWQETFEETLLMNIETIMNQKYPQFTGNFFEFFDILSLPEQLEVVTLLQNEAVRLCGEIFAKYQKD